MISASDRQLLRTLAQKVRDIAELPEMKARRQRLRKHNALGGERPLVLCFPEGAWRELVPEETLQCQQTALRDWEMELRQKIYWWEHIRDDGACDPCFNIAWVVDTGDYGVPVQYHHGKDRGSYVWDVPIKDFDKDFSKLKQRSFAVDRSKTQRRMELASELFGDILPPRIRGRSWWTMGLTNPIIRLIGLENLMLWPYDQPLGLHKLMAFLRDDHLNLLTWTEKEGLLCQCNESDYVGSGGYAYSDELPQKDWQPGSPVRLIDVWGFGESQETVNCSPAMFEEFVLPYQVPLLEKFGLNCYGCCEGVHLRIDALFKAVPRLRRVSVAPWADQKIMAEKLAGRAIFSRKPNPALVCVEFDEQIVRQDVRRTLEIAGKTSLELILKDTHTVQNQPQRITRWVQIALEEVQRFSG